MAGKQLMSESGNSETGVSISNESSAKKKKKKKSAGGENELVAAGEE